MPLLSRQSPVEGCYVTVRLIPNVNPRTLVKNPPQIRTTSLRYPAMISRRALLSKQLLGLAEEDEDVKLLMTIPGIGYYSALLVKSEIGNVDRFPFGERLCSYAGLVPSTYASGKAVRHGAITKEGSRWLRWVVIQAAQTHV